MFFRYTLVLLFLIISQNLDAQVSSDCSGSVPICDNTGSGGNVNGPGMDDFNGAGNSGCLQDGGAGTGQVEANSAWYTFQTNETGQLGFDIGPTNTNEDWDFALYGPFTSATGNCGAISTDAPIRCNYAGAAGSALGGFTGVGVNPISGNQENHYDPFLNVNAGDVYVLLINNFSNTNNGFNLSFSGTLFDNGNNPLDCSIVNAALPPVVDVCGTGASNPVTLDATTANAINYTWQLDTGAGFNPIPGTDGNPMITATTSGVYEVTVTAANGDMDSAQSVVTFYDPPTATAPANITVCDTAPFNNEEDFNLDALRPVILNGQDPMDFDVTFHLSQAAAEAGTGALGGTTAYGSPSDTIWIRVDNNGFTTDETCNAVTSFELIVNPAPILNAGLDTSVCSEEASGITLSGTAASSAIASYNITAINTNGLTASAGVPTTGTGFTATEIIDDAFTNNTAANVDVVYTIVPVGTNTCVGAPVNVTLTVEAAPVLDPNLDAVACSDVASGINLGVTATSPPAATYNITAINTNGLTASSGTPVVANNLPSTEIADDAYTNSTNATVNVVYTIVPVSASGCEGAAVNVTLTVQPQPILSTTLDTTVCSDTPSGITLNTNGTSVAAATYNITSLNSNGLTASAGTPGTGIGFTDTEIVDDAWTNITGADVIVVYTIAPVSAAGCVGNEVVVNLTIQPEPVLNAGLNNAVCSEEPSGITLSSAAASSAIASYNVIAINMNGLTPSAGAPVTGSGFTDTEIIDDAYTNTTGANVNVTYTIAPLGVNNCLGDEVDIILTIETAPILGTNLDAAVCSDIASGITLGVAAGSTAATTFNITSIVPNGLTASAGAPVMANGVPANEISDDAYTNTTNANVAVIYTVVPVSASGCEGAPVDVTLTVQPQPVLSTTLNTTVCSDTSSGITLTSDAGSIGAATYNITNIINNGLTASAGAPITGTGFPDNEISDDSWTNTTSAAVNVTYTIVPVSGSGCNGNSVDVVLTIQPEPLGNGVPSNQEICTTETLSIALDPTVDIPSDFVWNAVDNPDIMGETLAPGNTTAIIDDTLTNTSTADTTVEYIIIPTSIANGCVGDPYSIFVTVVATPILDPILDQNDCDTFTFPEITQMGTVRPDAYFSTNPNGTGDTFTQNQTITYFDFFPGQYPVTIYAYEVTTGPAACESPVNSFTLNITRSPEATAPADYPLCDENNDDTEIYDLTSRNAEVFGALNTTTHNIIWFDNAADANDPMAVSNITDDTMHPFTADFPLTDPPTQIVYARVTEETSGNNCFDVVPLTLILNPDPILFEPFETFEVCDDDTPNGMVIVDLSINDQNIAGPNTPADLTVSYHNTPQDAVDGVGAVDKFNYQTLPPPYPYTLYTRVTNNTTGCHDEGEIAITVLQAPAVTAPTPYELCDPDNDDSTTFMLSSKNNEIAAGDPTLTITYYPTESDATLPVVATLLDDSAYTNNTNPEIVWARVENAGGCATVVPVELRVLDTPMPNDTPDDYALCDFDGDALEVFDLTTREVDLLGGLDPMRYSVTWYADLTNAQNGTADIPDATNHSSAGGDVYAVVQDETQSATTFCQAIVTLTLVVEAIPVPIQPVAYELCDDQASGSSTDMTSLFDLTSRDATIVGPNTSWSVTWYNTQIGADTADPADLIAAPTAHSYMSMPAGNIPVWARVIDTSTMGNCHATVSLTLVVQPNPSPTTVPDVEECDGSDGILDDQAIFDLTDEAVAIANGELVMITFHETQQDAIDNMDAVNAAAYQSGSRTLWVRSTEDDPALPNTACFTIIQITLIVLDTPQPSAPPADYALCDDGADGVEVFDLTTREMDVLGGLDPLRYSVTWYADLTNAQNGTPDIPNPATHSSGAGDVYAVIQDNTQSTTTFCQAIITLTLVLEDNPMPLPADDYELCDDEASGSPTDMTSLFDLTSQEASIIGSNASWDVTWYNTQAGADAADPADLIATPTAHPYMSMATGDVPVWARVEDTSTTGNCYAILPLTLVVQPNPNPILIPDVEECDGSDGVLDGQAIFDLTDEAVIIANGELVMITFHETQQNAIDNMDAINAAAYPSGTRVLWVRATEDDPARPNTACFTIIEINLIVQDTPEITATMADLELTACDDADGSMDGTATFDLTENDALILGTLPAADYSITYHLTQASAETPEGEPGHNAIVNPGAYTFGPPATGTIWVRLEDTTQPNTACAAVTSFTINVGMTPDYEDPEMSYFACDSLDSGDDMDGIATFDLTLITADITQNNPDLVITYYADPADVGVAGADIQPQTAYQGTGADPQTISILITSTDPGMCSVIVTTDLRVNPVPVLISDPLPDAIACDPDNDEFSDFDLDAYGLLILDGQTTLDLSFYELLSEAENGDPTDAITNTASYDNIVPNQVLYVRAQDNVNATACAKVFPFTLQSHPTPLLPATALEDLVECDDDGDNAEDFDLTVYTQPLLDAQTPPNTAAEFTVSYHDTQASAQDVTDTGVADAANYTLTTAASPLTIFARILYNDGSDCFTITTFDISVEALPGIGTYAEDLEVCDDDNDQIAIFDLTIDQDQITTDPLLQVDYYESQASFDAGDPAIVDPTAYTNTANPQIIVVVATSQAGCEAQVQRTIRVLPIPTPDNVNPDPVVVCDDDFDGFFDFDLTPTVNEIDPASAPTVIRIFESFAQAESYDATTNTPTPATDAAAGYLYTNSVPNGQTLYARVDHDPAIVMDNTCNVIVPFEVVVNPLPVVNPDRVDPYVFCEQEDGDDSMGMLILENIASEINLLQAPQAEGDFFITYHEDQSQAQTDDFALSSPYNFDENVLNGLWIRIENRVTGCFVVEFLEIVVEARPVAQQPEDLMVCEDIVPDAVNGIPTPGRATIDLTVQDEMIFGGPLGPTDQVNYFTSLADATANTNAIPDPTMFMNTSDPQVIWAVVEDTTTSCPSSPPVSFTVDVKEVPYTDLSDTGGDICVDPATGEVLELITLDATPETIIPGAIYTYAWRLDGSLVSIDPTITVEAVGTYSVTVTAIYTDAITGMIHECSYQAETTFTAISAPLFEVEVVEDAFNSGGTYTVQVVEGSITGFGSAEYEFSIDDGPFGESTVFTNVRPGEHTVFGRRVDGNCPPTPVEIGIIDYPRFFTPNNDGFHDTWNILGIGTPPNLNAKIYIFDRYGKLLKQISPTSPGWNGTFNGQPMPSNDYWFRVEYNEADEDGQLIAKEFSGHFTLKR